MLRTGVIAALVLAGGDAVSATRLGVDGARFTLDGKPAFLYGISYYGALGAPEETIRADLDEMGRTHLNWVRVWATWGAFDNDVSAVDADGSPREPYLGRLKWLVAECDRRGMVVDVTLSRGNGATGNPRLQTLEAHLRATEALVGTLKPYRNWYLDLSNERNIRDRRYSSMEDLARLTERVRALDPERLVTASHVGDPARADLEQYLRVVGLDFVSPHRGRSAGTAAQTEEKCRETLALMREVGRVAPVHYQEPFRRGFGKWEPAAEDFVADALGARAGGAAGWCLHNGHEGESPDGRPRRSFDLREKRLFEQLDGEEKAALQRLRAEFAGRPEE